MRLSDAVKEIEEWMDHKNIGYIISEAETKAEGEVQVHIYEPGALEDEYFYTVRDGIIFNDCGEDVFKLHKKAFNSKPSDLEFLDYFEKKWTKNPACKIVQIPEGYLKIEPKNTEYPGVYISSVINGCEELLTCTEYDALKKELVTCCYIEGTDEPSIIFRHEDGEDLR